MSTPMFDLPEHLDIPVNADGQGPCHPDEEVRRVCWCGDDECQEWRP